jgi:AIG2-like family
MKYFAYGSNMSSLRLRARTPGARALGVGVLKAHDLRFHKVGQDGSGKCDAFHTNNPADSVVGVLYEIDHFEKGNLDKAEGLGRGYNEKTVNVFNALGEEVTAFTYYATAIDELLSPFSWYRHHVLVGAREASLQQGYIMKIEAVECVEDPDQQRDARQRAMYREYLA